MDTDHQVRRLRKLLNSEKNQEIAASKAGMDPKTARKYLAANRLPRESAKERHWPGPTKCLRRLTIKWPFIPMHKQRLVIIFVLLLWLGGLTQNPASAQIIQ